MLYKNSWGNMVIYIISEASLLFDLLANANVYIVDQSISLDTVKLNVKIVFYTVNIGLFIYNLI